MKPSSSSRARMLRTVADDTPRPAALTRTDEATGSPDAMYSRTSAARTRFDRSWGSEVIYVPAGVDLLELALALRDCQTLYTGPRRQIPRRRARLGGDLPRVHAHRQPVSHEHLSVHNRDPDVGGAGGVDDRRVRVGARGEMRPVAIDDDQVGALAGLD